MLYLKEGKLGRISVLVTYHSLTCYNKYRRMLLPKDWWTGGLQKGFINVFNYIWLHFKIIFDGDL